jgi:hypothetical protein
MRTQCASGDPVNRPRHGFPLLRTLPPLTYCRARA